MHEIKCSEQDPCEERDEESADGDIGALLEEVGEEGCCELDSGRDQIRADSVEICLGRGDGKAFDNGLCAD